MLMKETEQGRDGGGRSGLSCPRILAASPCPGRPTLHGHREILGLTMSHDVAAAYELGLNHFNSLTLHIFGL